MLVPCGWGSELRVFKDVGLSRVTASRRAGATPWSARSRTIARMVKPVVHDSRAARQWRMSDASDCDLTRGRRASPKRLSVAGGSKRLSSSCGPDDSLPSPQTLSASSVSARSVGYACAPATRTIWSTSDMASSGQVRIEDGDDAVGNCVWYPSVQADERLPVLPK